MVFREMKKLSSELYSILRVGKGLGKDQTLAYALTIIQHDEEYKHFAEELEDQIVQYGPDTTVSELLLMSKDES